ncbi:hypothetical protein DMENIID0001_139770 [Sergentomyia squamirostris]
MALLEHLKKWNEVMPHKISEEQLRLPSEEFMTNCLTSILMKINRKLPDGLYSKDEQVQLKSKLKLCHTVSALYKLSNEKNGFYYTDLIEPTPKRALHLLQNLLNYVLYYEMIYDEMQSACKEKFDELNSLNFRTSSLQGRIEELQEDCPNTHDFEMNIPVVEAEIIDKKATLLEIDQKCREEEEKVTILKKDLHTIELEISQMKSDLMPPEVLEHLQQEILKFQQQQNEISEIIAAAKLNNDEILKENKVLNEHITSYEVLQEKLEKCSDLLPSTKTSISELEENIQVLQKQINAIATFEQDVKAKEEVTKKQIIAIQEDLTQVRSEYEKNLQNLKKKMEMLISDNEQMQVKENELKEELQKMEQETVAGAKYVHDMLRLLKQKSSVLVLRPHTDPSSISKMGASRTNTMVISHVSLSSNPHRTQMLCLASDEEIYHAKEQHGVRSGDEFQEA